MASSIACRGFASWRRSSRLWHSRWEAEGLVVSEAIKFPVRLQTRRKDHVEIQTHGYEVDLVGARAAELVLASVKS